MELNLGNGVRFCEGSVEEGSFLAKGDNKVGLVEVIHPGKAQGR